MLLSQAADNANQNVSTSVVLVALFVALLIFAVFMTFLVGFFRIWLQAFLSGARISFFEILGMKLRRTNAKQIIGCRVMSVQAGTPIATGELEAAFLSGVDIVLATRAYIDAAKSGKTFTFEELADANRSEQLAEMLGMKKG